MDLAEKKVRKKSAEWWITRGTNLATHTTNLNKMVMNDFQKKVHDFVTKLNAKNILYDTPEFDALVEDLFEDHDQVEYECIENYTGPSLDTLDDLAAQGRSEECAKEHQKARANFLADGSFNVLERNDDMEEEITVSWERAKDGTIGWSMLF